MTTTATYGVDLASQPAKTAVCAIEWKQDGSGRVDCPGQGAADTEILAMLTDEAVTVSGIDAPFGWPSDFLDALMLYQASGDWPDPPSEQAHQDLMRLRVTDRAVHHETGLTPLSVSTDKIGIVAMRCARLLSAYWRHSAGAPDRSGRGRLVEVYPAAALVQWGISQRAGVEDPGTYKGPTPAAQTRRARIYDAIADTAPRLEMHEKVRVVCIDSDDCLDALICALIARACELDLVLPIPADAPAEVEGWIRLPQPGSLKALWSERQGSGGSHGRS